MGHGRLDSILGSNPVPGIDFPPPKPNQNYWLGLCGEKIPGIEKEPRMELSRPCSIKC